MEKNCDTKQAIYIKTGWTGLQKTKCKKIFCGNEFCVEKFFSREQTFA